MQNTHHWVKLFLRDSSMYALVSHILTYTAAYCLGKCRTWHLVKLLALEPCDLSAGESRQFLPSQSAKIHVSCSDRIMCILPTNIINKTGRSLNCQTVFTFNLFLDQDKLASEGIFFNLLTRLGHFSGVASWRSRIRWTGHFSRQNTSWFMEYILTKIFLWKLILPE